MPEQAAVILIQQPETHFPAALHMLHMAVGIQRPQCLHKTALIIAQKIPAAVIGILFSDNIGDHLRPVFGGALKIAEKALLKTETDSQMHGQHHQHTGGKNGEKQFVTYSGFHAFPSVLITDCPADSPVFLRRSRSKNR